MKPRISVFPSSATELEDLKEQTMSPTELGSDESQQDGIAQLYVESSLTLLRQLQVQYMNCDLDD